jgi:seryl-tRNA synthetase
MTQGARIARELESLEAENKESQAKLRDFVALIPNLLHESVPFGSSAEQNAESAALGRATQVRFQAQGPRRPWRRPGRHGLRYRRQARRRALSW